ncbi:hypothetical protein B0H65DRAFT_455826 [Neurospora tetraspora]|uniref:Uncharacterized protein n=1 Tax=Neurospora tetraspora TaxID=94610 RepID=A0AAE0JJZ8_9PEZI|nr:hypothetical protein B0H65DRAFT_455826 [Neurospora tetraspora]
MYDSSSGDDDTPKIIVLQGEENFGIWEGYAIRVLRMLGLEGFIRGTETPPLGNTPENMKELRSFKDRKWHAWSLLYESVQILVAQKHIRRWGPYDRLDDCDPKVLWDAVQRWYTNIDPTQKLAFLRELTTIDYRQFDDIDAFLDRAEWLQRRLGRLGMPISDEMMKTCLYGGVFPHHPSKILESLIIVRYDKWDSETMISEIRKHIFAIQDQANKHQQEQQEINRPRNANRQSSEHRGGSRQRGRRH